ncbi:hypothetical protein PENTCL1PPCAC_5714 [Pristionchus entomophagus]|uniref:Uncharacterized protein n=1 Tax=Pristionchus entomophagus TaxID=358040 RepID=A0AAV5SKU9_9BILA|nr:hypothetical protein PENTCL1PPCAC_5714 [Pristionchus entomophagus]
MLSSCSVKYSSPEISRSSPTLVKKSRSSSSSSSYSSFNCSASPFTVDPVLCAWREPLFSVPMRYRNISQIQSSVR